MYDRLKTNLSSNVSRSPPKEDVENNGGQAVGILIKRRAITDNEILTYFDTLMVLQLA